MCGTHPAVDWDAIAKALAIPRNSLETGPTLHIGFGLHPWFVPSDDAAEVGTATAGSEPGEGCDCGSVSPAQAAPPDACATASPTSALTLAEILGQLEQRLREYPRALVAEIGLDRLRGPSEATQADAFKAQLRLAAAYSRPVSVHCVRHYGLLMDVLQELPADDVPPAIIVHAFTGSLEVARSLLSLKNKKRAAPASQHPQPQPQQPGGDAGGTGETEERKRTKRAGASVAAAAHTVRIKERIFFGVSLSTSFTVKNFAAQTLLFLLDTRRVLLETDVHYAGVALASSSSCPPGTPAASYVVDVDEQAGAVTELVNQIQAAVAQHRELGKKAEAAGQSMDELVKDALQHAYTEALRSVAAPQDPISAHVG